MKLYVNSTNVWLILNKAPIIRNHVVDGSEQLAFLERLLPDELLDTWTTSDQAHLLHEDLEDRLGELRFDFFYDEATDDCVCRGPYKVVGVEEFVCYFDLKKLLKAICNKRGERAEAERLIWSLWFIDKADFCASTQSYSLNLGPHYLE